MLAPGHRRVVPHKRLEVDPVKRGGSGIVVADGKQLGILDAGRRRQRVLYESKPAVETRAQFHHRAEDGGPRSKCGRREQVWRAVIRIVRIRLIVEISDRVDVAGQGSNARLALPAVVITPSV